MHKLPGTNSHRITMAQSMRTFLLKHRYRLVLLAFALFAYYASFETHRITARYATEWMNIFSFRDYPTREALKDYLVNLRTGIPPVLSSLEILSYNLRGEADWVVKGLYRKALIGMLILPLFFLRKNLWLMGYVWVSAWLLLQALLDIHVANPQLYDVLLPCFILLYLLSSRYAQRPGTSGWWGAVLALAAGFFLSMAELARPFMLVPMPLLLLYNLYHLGRNRLWWRMACFLFPLLLLSGGWHAKLWIYNEHQLIWSNHSGTNLFRAWIPFVDQERLAWQLEEEAAPLRPGRWQNLNTAVHARNSDRRKAAVWAGIRQQPAEALSHLWEKTRVFTGPRTDMYDSDPQGVHISLYKYLIRGIYLLLPILGLWLLVLLWRRKIGLLEEPVVIFGFCLFLTLMPVLGESGEEARFVVSVIPFLIIAGGYLLSLLVEKGISRNDTQPG